MIQTTTVLDETRTPRPGTPYTRTSGYSDRNARVVGDGNGANSRPTRARQAITAASGLMLLFNLMGR